MIPIHQCDLLLCNPSGIWTELSGGSDFCLATDASSGHYHIKKTMERKSAAAAASLQLEEKQNRKHKCESCYTEARRCVGHDEWCWSMYSNTWSEGVNLPHNSKMVEPRFDWHRIPSISTPPPASPLIWLPLQRNEGQRSAHMLCWKTSSSSQNL